MRFTQKLNNSTSFHILTRFCLEVKKKLLSEKETAIKLLISTEVYRYYKQEYGADESYIKSLQVQITEIDKKLNNIMSAIEAGIFNDTTQARMQELNEQKKRLNDELTLQNNIEKFSLSQEDVLRYLEAFTDFDDKNIRELLLECLVDKIYLYDDKIVIDFFYSDDKKEISFDDVNAQIALYERFNQKGIINNVSSSSVSDCPFNRIWTNLRPN